MKQLLTAIIIVAATLVSFSVQSTPVEITFAGQWRDIRGMNSVGFGPGDRHILDALVENGSGEPAPAGTVVHAMQGGSTVELFRLSDIVTEFGASRSWNTLPTGIWTTTANHGTDTDSAMTHDISGVGALPFVRNVWLSGDSLAPTVSWQLPTDNTVPFNRVRIGLFDDTTNHRLLFPNGDLFINLPATATSFTFPTGMLEEDRPYALRVVLDDRDEGGSANRSTTFVNFTPGAADAQGFFIPTVDAKGVYHFDFDVEAAEPVRIDPFIAIGYDYEIGTGDPLFTSVLLPEVGDDLFDLWLFDNVGDAFDTGIDLMSNVLFDFTTLGFLGGIDYSVGAERFRILGIESEAMLDPSDTTAFVTTLTFASSGAFTGTMAPITAFVPEPTTLALMGLGLAGIGYRRRQLKKA